MTSVPGPSLKNLSLTGGQSTLASAFFASAPSTATTGYAVEDLGGDGGYFLFGNLKLASGTIYDLTASQMQSLQYVAGTGAGSDKLAFQTYSGGVWSAVSYAQATTAAPAAAVAAPKLTGKNATLEQGQSVAASTLIGSIVNPGTAKTTQYAFTDAGANGGQLVLNGQALTAGTVYDLTAAQLAQLTYVAGTGGDTITSSSYDGAAWSNAASVTITTVAPPSVSGNKETIVGGQTIAGSSLIASVADPAGHAITEYAFMAAGTDGGQLFLNGKAVTAGAWVTLTAAQLAQLTYIGGIGAGP